MLNSKILVLCISTFMVGCSAKVVTYDREGERIGSCKVSSFLIPIHGVASCYGYANDDNLRFANMNAKGELELRPIPQAAKIKLQQH